MLYPARCWAFSLSCFEHRRPGMFYAFGFLLTYEAGKLFDDIRSIGLGLVQAYQNIGG
jgi:hypothetical protein